MESGAPYPTKKSREQEDPALPRALHDLLIKARSALRARGDDGSRGTTTVVKLDFGWPEVRAVYQLHTSLRKTREARDTFRRQLKALRAERAHSEQVRATLKSRDVLHTLLTVEALLQGDETSKRAVHDALAGVQKMLKGRR